MESEREKGRGKERESRKRNVIRLLVYANIFTRMYSICIHQQLMYTVCVYVHVHVCTCMYMYIYCTCTYTVYMAKLACSILARSERKKEKT